MSKSERFTVDLGRLKETSTKVRTDTDQGLRPGISDTNGKMQHGVRFGMLSPSGEIAAAAGQFGEALSIHFANGQSHVNRAEQLANVLDLILSNYRNADELSRMDIRTVEKLIYEAVPKTVIPEGTKGPMFE